MDASSNGSDSHGHGAVATMTVDHELSPAAAAISSLRRQPRNIHLARGFGPLVVGLALFLLMLWLAPSVAPEHIVEKPVSTTSTTVVATTTTPAATTSAPATTDTTAAP